MTRILLIGLGGALGSIMRYGVSEGFRVVGPANFPWGTLTVNIAGCFVIGVLMAVFAGPIALREDLKLCILVGVLGGFTTFSAFARETLAMVHEQRYWPAAVYVLLSNCLGMAAVWFGHFVARR